MAFTFNLAPPRVGVPERDWSFMDTIMQRREDRKAGDAVQQFAGGLPPEDAARYAPLLRNAQTRDMALKEIMARGRPKELPGSVQEYQYAQQDPGFLAHQLRLKAAGKNAVNVNVGPSGIDYGDPEKGLAWARNPDGSVRLDERGAPVALPYQGGSVFRDQEAERIAKDMRDDQRNLQGNIVIDDISRTLDLVNSGSPVTGIGSVAAAVPGTAAHDASNLLNTIKANVGFDKLQAMREASPTGGALGQVSENENRLLQSVLGALEQSQSREQFTYNLMRLANTYNDIIHGPGKGPPRHQITRPSDQGRKAITEMTDEELEALANGN